MEELWILKVPKGWVQFLLFHYLSKQPENADIILLLILSLFRIKCLAQNNQVADSLNHELSIASHDTSRVMIMYRLAEIFVNTQRDSSKSRMYGEQALNLARKIRFAKGEVLALMSLGHLFRTSGDFPKALALEFKGLQIAEEEEYQYGAGKCLNEIAIIYSQFNDLPNALNYFKRAITKFESIHHTLLVAYLEVNIARTYRRENKLDSAMIYLQKSKKKIDLLEPSDLNSWYLLELGSSQIRLGKYQAAYENLHKCISICEKNNYQFHLAFVYNVMAGCLKDMNQPDSSIYYAKKGLAASHKINFKVGILEASTQLAEHYESKNPGEALYYHKIAKFANEELYGASIVQGLQKTIFDEQKRQRELELAHLNYQNKSKLYASLAALIVLLLISFILYRNNRQKQNANKVLENTLFQLKATQTQLIQSEKLASLGELTAGIAHEIQNPLNFVNNFSELSVDLAKELKEEAEKPEIDRDLIVDLATDLSQNQEKINHHGKRASSIVKGMLEHSRASTGKKELTDINALADEYLRLSYHGLRAKDNTFNADFRTDFEENLPKIEVIAQDFGRVLLNLINNAFYAVKNVENPLVELKTEKLDNQILIKVRDNGVGMNEMTKAKIFQPFFTTKPTGEGTGLGLSLAYDIITKGHGGMIEVESTEGLGSEFIITLPIKNN